MRWLNKWFSFSWKKLALVAALVPVILYCQQDEFPRVDAFIKDRLQLLNNPKTVDKNLVTININGKTNHYKRPFTPEVFTSVIDKVLSYEPRYVILCFSQREFNKSGSADALLYYLKDKKNVFLQANYTFAINNMYKHAVLKTYPRFVFLAGTGDVNYGARDKKSRRVLLSYDKIGPSDEIELIKELGLQPKSQEDFKYKFRFWETDQVYMKTYPLGTFGSFDATEVLNDEIESSRFKDKIILLGSFDEFSFSGLPSVLNFSDKLTGDNFRTYYYPETDNMANLLNTLLTADYVKMLPNFNDLMITLVLLLLIIFLKLTQKNKLITFVSLIPIFIFITTITYFISNFYLDFSRSIVLLFFLQYFGVPIIMFNMFKEQESKKLQEINDARIDALLTVSEKVAHDIRSPLSAINLVAERAIFPDVEYKEIFDGAVKRIDETATKILTQYRTSTGRDHEKLERINLSEIVNDITREKKILNSKIDFEFVSNLVNEGALGIKLDLERIISNILDNSIFAMKHIINPKIFIAIEENENMIRLNITDNGTGIPEQILKVIGNARITTKIDTNQGNGIGLLHAKRVIERLNGKFEITSEENVGTTIKISLPKA